MATVAAEERKGLSVHVKHHTTAQSQSDNRGLIKLLLNTMRHLIITLMEVYGTPVESRTTIALLSFFKGTNI